MNRSRTTLTSLLSAAVLASTLLGSAAVAGAAPALAAPPATAGAQPTSAGAPAAPAAAVAVGDSRPIPGSRATSAQVVAAWYARFLDAGLPIDRYPGSRYWMARLDAGQNPQAVLSDLLATREYAGSAVTAIYRAYLDRTPDAGASYWIEGVASGAFPLEWVEQNVASSNEFLLRTSTDGALPGSGRVDTTVQTWYSIILGRAPSAGERSYWLARFGSASPLGVLRELWYTPEAVTYRIQSHYSSLLGRAGSAGEVAYWYGPEVASDITVITRFATTTEYADRAAAARR